MQSKLRKSVGSVDLRKNTGKLVDPTPVFARGTSRPVGTLTEKIVLTVAILALLTTVIQLDAQQKKQIKDPAEYNAYMGAVQQQDPNAESSGLEAFLTQYPNSVMKEDALETLMGAYQRKGDVAMMGDTAQRLLQVNPNSIKGLAIVTYSKLAQQNLAEADQNGQKCLAALPNAPKPDNTSAEEWDKTKTQIGGICNRAVGLAALNNKDYPKAVSALHGAVEAAPNDVNVIYPLSQAYLKQTPPDTLNGLWFTARAAGLAPTPQAQQQIEKYGASVYRNYHGSDQGWSDLMAQTKTTPFPPGTLLTTEAPSTGKKPAPPGFDIPDLYEQELKTAMALWKNNQVPDASKATAALIKSDPSRWEGYGLAGAIERAQNKVAEAKAAYQRALSLAPDNVKPQIEQAIQEIESEQRRP